MSWLEDELQKQWGQEEAYRRQEKERIQQEQETARRREQEEGPLRDQRSQQLVQMGRQQLNPLLNSLQVPELLQDANRHLRDPRYQGRINKTSLDDNFYALGNYHKLTEPLRLAGWDYTIWLIVESEKYDDWGDQGGQTLESRSTIRIHLWRDERATRIAIETLGQGRSTYDGSKFPDWRPSNRGTRGFGKESTELIWEKEVTSSNTNEIVTQLKDSIVQEIREILEG